MMIFCTFGLQWNVGAATGGRKEMLRLRQYTVRFSHFKRHFRMIKPFLKKAITLLSSLSLVILFLSYRVGTFDTTSLNDKPALQTSHNDGNITPSPIDTTKPKNDSVNPLMISSSKVLILTDKKPTFLDSSRQKLLKYKYPKSETEILSSSKSAIIFKPQQTYKINLDSFKLKYDTLKTKKQKNK